jgi:hypothetical protein
MSEKIEIIKLDRFQYKIRSKDNRKYYDAIRRQDGSFFCSCPSHMYFSEVCRHIKALKEIEK